MKWFNEANKQLQCWPTPEIWVGRGLSPLFEYGVPYVALTGFEAYTGQLSPAQSEAGRSGVSMTAMIVNGAQPLPVTESGVSGVAMTDFVSVVKINTPAQTEALLSGVAMPSFINIVPISPTAQADAYLSQVSMTAFIV